MIYIVGAGPGDPELLTVRAQRLLQQADLVIYTGSLINPEILKICRPSTQLVDSSGLVLAEIIALMQQSYQRGLCTVRLHTGDPSLFGAIGEQMAELDRLNIPYQIVPGVSSFLAAAAAIKRQYTVPEQTQTLIITRCAGRTPVPQREDLSRLAAHRSSMAIFLSAGLAEQVQQQLLQSYPPDTPVALIYKVSWPEERIIHGRLDQLAQLTEAHRINSTALILVGEFIRQTGRSKLYDEGFSHGCRS